MFSDDYECKTIIENGLLNDVMCKVESVYKVDSRSKIIVNQRLTFVQSFESKPVPSHGKFFNLNFYLNKIDYKLLFF